MWFVYFVLTVGALIGSLVLGWATYLERSQSRTKIQSPFADHVPLPVSRPKQMSTQLFEDETVREVKTGNTGYGTKSRRKTSRGTW
jgi:hypothetical protein